jgi:hypothetical protein
MGELAKGKAVSVRFFLAFLNLMRSRWMFRLGLSNDANFRLNNVLRSSAEKDPWLGHGYSYFVEEEPYNSWVISHAAEEEVRYFTLSCIHCY